MTFTPEQIRERIAALGPWYHNIDLGRGIWTLGGEHGAARGAYAPEVAAAIPADLTGKRVLDLGCNAGYFSFLCEDRGATVIGIDRNKDFIRQARFCAKVKESKVTFCQRSVYGIDKLGTFDLVLFLGLCYHLTDLDGMFTQFKVVCSDMMIFETAAFTLEWEHKLPLVLITTENHPAQAGHQYPNRAAIYHFLRRGGFKDITPVFERTRACYIAHKHKQEE